MDMLPLNTLDVTEVARQFLHSDKIVIPATINMSALFGVANNGEQKYLQIEIDDNLYNIANDFYIDDVIIYPAAPKHLRIVYYIYCNPNSNWRGIISSQLLQLKSFGILSEADLFIHITDCFGLAEAVKSLIYEIAPYAVLTVDHKNQYEYPGIKLIYDLANQHPDGNFIYLHSKGMSHNVHSRQQTEINLFSKTFKNWRRNLQYLGKNGIEKIGLFPGILNENSSEIEGRRGWIWYNYWYASGRYLAKCPDPEVTEDRYYYEGWLGIQSRKRLEIDCKSLYEIKGINKTYFSPTEADFYLSIAPKEPVNLSKRVVKAFNNAKIAHRYLRFEQIFNRLLRKNG